MAPIKPYILPTLLFLGCFAAATLIRQAALSGLGVWLSGLLFWTFILLVFAMVVSVFSKREGWSLFRYNRPGPQSWWLLFILLLLFVMNNTWMVWYDFDKAYAAFIFNHIAAFVCSISLSSIAEELIYRGFIQTYINRRTVSTGFFWTKGSWYASLLMTLSHLGFYSVMTPLFATSSLILVFLFSMSAGYMKERSGGLWLPLLAHLLCNYVHGFIHYIYAMPFECIVYKTYG